MNRITVIYHNWKPLGQLSEFMESYLAHDAGAAHDLLIAERSEGWDIACYIDIARSITSDWLLCLNSYTRFRSNDWLRFLMLHKMVGHAVGAFASDEGGLDNYPNPHVRSNCFLVYRDDLAKFPIPTSKAECYLFEHGPQGLSRQLYPVAVASTGMAWSSYQWRDRRMFRQEDQADLLFSDNKTREYDLANPGERERLRRLAWGDAVPAEGM